MLWQHKFSVHPPLCSGISKTLSLLMTTQNSSNKTRPYAYDDKFMQEFLAARSDIERYTSYKKIYSIGWDACIFILKTNESIDLEHLKMRLYDDAFCKSIRDLEFGSEEFNFSNCCYSKGYDDCADFLADEFGISAMQGANSFIGERSNIKWRQMLDFIGINYTRAILK